MKEHVNWWGKCQGGSQVKTIHSPPFRLVISNTHHAKKTEWVFGHEKSKVNLTKNLNVSRKAYCVLFQKHRAHGIKWWNKSLKSRLYKYLLSIVTEMNSFESYDCRLLYNRQYSPKRPWTMSKLSDTKAGFDVISWNKQGKTQNENLQNQ